MRELDVADRWLAAMRRGDWVQAWCETDRIELPRRERQRRPGFLRRPGELCWDGTPLAGRSVLVRCEHGLGDTLQFIRFVPSIVRVARAVHVMMQPALLELFAGAPDLGTVHNGWTQWWPPPRHDVEIEIMELAYALRATPETLPPPYPHLNARADADAVPAVARGREFRVGLVWAASDWDGTRSIPLALFRPLVAVPGVRCFSLQQGEAAADPLVGQLGIEPLSRRTGAIVAAAAAMQELDLIVTVDNMVAHLAATLGRPTWVLLKRDADWRWMDARADSPWYPTMRLFRQQREGDWEGVLEAAARALAAGQSAPLSPLSLRA